MITKKYVIHVYDESTGKLIPMRIPATILEPILEPTDKIMKTLVVVPEPSPEENNTPKEPLKRGRRKKS